MPVSILFLLLQFTRRKTPQIKKMSNMTHNEETQKHLSAIEDAKNFFQAEIDKREAEIAEHEKAIDEIAEADRLFTDDEITEKISELNEEIANLTTIRIDLSNAEVSIESAFELA